MNFTEEQAQQLREYAKSLPDTDRKNFISKFQSLPDDKQAVVMQRLFSESTPTVNNPTSSGRDMRYAGLPNLSQVEELIKSRPDAMDALKRELQYNPMANGFHPLDTVMKPLVTGLKGLAVPLQRVQSAIANPALEIQKGNINPISLAKTSMQGITGKSKGEYGDLIRTTGFGGNDNEFLAGTTGLLASGAKFAPETMTTNAIASGLGKAALATKIPQLVSAFGNKVVSKALSVFSQVPEESMSKALSNPKYLKAGWLKKEGKRVGEEYQRVIKPLLDNSKNKVDVSSLKDVASDLGMISKSGEWTKEVTSLKPGEVRKILKWEQAVQKGSLSFNQVDALIGEMDSSLQPLYRSKEQGKVIAYSDKFKRLTNVFRGKLNELRKTQFPEAGKVLSDYEAFKAGETVHRNFDRWLPHLIPSIVGGAAASALGFSGAGAYAPLTLGAIPKLQGYGIRAVDLLSRNIGKSGAILPEVAFNEWKNNQ